MRAASAARGLAGRGARPVRARRVAQQAVQIKRSTGLRPGAGKPLASEGLHTDHRADDVAIDVDVADARALENRIARGIDTRGDTERQAITGGIDRID